jgi:AraC-like DNA-binding protein/ligand-binding sensor protein
LPKTIRKTLLAKLQTSQTFAELCSDFKAIAKVDLRLVEPNCMSSKETTLCNGSPSCAQTRSVIDGTVHCRQFVNKLITETQSEPVFCSRCDAGLTTVCVPMRLGYETIGYLLAGSYRVDSADRAASVRMNDSHKRVNSGEADNWITELKDDEPPVITEAQHKAFVRWLQLAAGTLIKSLHLKDDTMERPLPKFIIQICSIIQQFYKAPPTLGEAAKICNLSEGYFCRAFHEFTGLRFVEYIHAVRIEHVCELLLDSNLSITDAAFAVGFNSLSQFNRVFRRLKGTAPRKWRETA